MQDTAVIMRTAAASHGSQQLSDSSIDPTSDPSSSAAGTPGRRRRRPPSTADELSDQDSGISSNRSSSSSMDDSRREPQGHPRETHQEDEEREYDLDLETPAVNTDEGHSSDSDESTAYFGPTVDLEDAFDRLAIAEDNIGNEDLKELGPGQKRSKGDDSETNSQSHTQSKRLARHPPDVFEFSDEIQNCDSQRFRMFDSARVPHCSRGGTERLGNMQQTPVPPPIPDFIGPGPTQTQDICRPPPSSSSISSLSDLSDHVDTDAEACDLSLAIMDSAQQIEGTGLGPWSDSFRLATADNSNDFHQRHVDIINQFPINDLQTEKPFMTCQSNLVDRHKNASHGKSNNSSPRNVAQESQSIFCGSGVSSPGSLQSTASSCSSHSPQSPQRSSPMPSPSYSRMLQTPQGTQSILCSSGISSPESLKSTASFCSSHSPQSPPRSSPMPSPSYSRLPQTSQGCLKSAAYFCSSNSPQSSQGSLKSPPSLTSAACSRLSQSPPQLSQCYSLPPTPASSTDSESQSCTAGAQSDPTDSAILFPPSIYPLLYHRSSVVFPLSRLETSQNPISISEIEEVLGESESDDEQSNISLTDSPLSPDYYHILRDANGRWRKDESGETFLHSLAGLNEDVAIINLMNMRGLPGFELAINDYNKAKETPLYCAVSLQKYQLVKAFGEVGANVNTECCHHDKAHMAIHHAVEHLDEQMVLTLLHSFPYIDINARRPYDKLTALMVALLKHGTAVGSQQENITCNIVKRLFEYTVKHDISGLKIVDPKNGKTPLMMAVETKDLRIVSHFIIHINDVDKTRELINMQNKSGNSALHLAAGLRGLNDEVKGQMLRRLIMAGGDTNKKNIEGETPKDWARNIIEQVAKIK